MHDVKAAPSSSRSPSTASGRPRMGGHNSARASRSPTPIPWSSRRTSRHRWAAPTPPKPARLLLPGRSRLLRNHLRAGGGAQGIEVRALKAQAKPDVDQSRALGVTANPPVDLIDWHLEVDADAPREKLEELKHLARRPLPWRLVPPEPRQPAHSLGPPTLRNAAGCSAEFLSPFRSPNRRKRRCRAKAQRNH